MDKLCTCTCIVNHWHWWEDSPIYMYMYLHVYTAQYRLIVGYTPYHVLPGMLGEQYPTRLNPSSFLHSDCLDESIMRKRKRLPGSTRHIELPPVSYDPLCHFIFSRCSLRIYSCYLQIELRTYACTCTTIVWLSVPLRLQSNIQSIYIHIHIVE